MNGKLRRTECVTVNQRSSFGTLRLEARFDFFGLDSETIAAFSTSRGSVAVGVSTLASMAIEVSSCDIVEIVSLLFRVDVSRLFVCWMFVRS